MLIFENKLTNQIFVYIHIPKNSGKFIRNKIENDTNNKIIQSLWYISNEFFDMAHIPYMKRNEYIDNNTNYIFFSLLHFLY